MLYVHTVANSRLKHRHRTLTQSEAVTFGMQILPLKMPPPVKMYLELLEMIPARPVECHESCGASPRRGRERRPVGPALPTGQAHLSQARPAAAVRHEKTFLRSAPLRDADPASV